jgi:hypothetical protein
MNATSVEHAQAAWTLAVEWTYAQQHSWLIDERNQKHLS